MFEGHQIEYNILDYTFKIYPLMQSIGIEVNEFETIRQNHGMYLYYQPTARQNHLHIPHPVPRQYQVQVVEISKLPVLAPDQPGLRHNGIRARPPKPKLTHGSTISTIMNSIWRMHSLNTTGSMMQKIKLQRIKLQRISKNKIRHHGLMVGSIVRYDS